MQFDQLKRREFVTLFGCSDRMAPRRARAAAGDLQCRGRDGDALRGICQCRPLARGGAVTGAAVMSVVVDAHQHFWTYGTNQTSWMEVPQGSTLMAVTPVNAAGAELLPQDFLYFLAEPQGHGSFRPTFVDRTGS